MNETMIVDTTVLVKNKTDGYTQFSPGQPSVELKPDENGGIKVDKAHPHGEVLYPYQLLQGDLSTENSYGGVGHKTVMPGGYEITSFLDGTSRTYDPLTKTSCLIQKDGTNIIETPTTIEAFTPNTPAMIFDKQTKNRRFVEDGQTVFEGKATMIPLDQNNPTYSTNKDGADLLITIGNRSHRFQGAADLIANVSSYTSKHTGLSFLFVPNGVPKLNQ